MGSCTLIGIVFNYYVERFDEENANGETITTFKGSGQWGGMKTMFSDTLKGLLCDITKEAFNESEYYRNEILQFVQENFTNIQGIKGAK